MSGYRIFQIIVVYKLQRKQGEKNRLMLSVIHICIQIPILRFFLKVFFLKLLINCIDSVLCQVWFFLFFFKDAVVG